MAGLPTALEEAIEAARAELPAGQQALFGDFARVALRDVDLRMLRVRGAAALVGVAREMFDFASQRAPDEIRIRARNPGDRAGRTVIEILQRDRPFLVDTTRLLLRRLGLREQLFVHPVFGVRRDAHGRLTALDPGPDAPRESLIHVEVAPAVRDDLLERGCEGLREVMEQVRDVTDDHRRMIRLVRDLQANIEFADRDLPGGPTRADKICRFLDWLVEDHFVFIGARRYTLREVDGEPEVALRRGEGLGICRDDRTSRLYEPHRGEQIPDELREQLADHRIILMGKARLESSLHRGGRMDRILVKEHDEQGRVIGFAILFGLYTYRALREPGSQIPLLAERLAEILRDLGDPPGSHDYKATVSAFDSMPVEFLLSSDVQGIRSVIEGIVSGEGSEEARLLLWMDPAERSFYAAVLLPRERYREELRGAIRLLLEQRTGANYIDDRTSFLEEGTALLHYFCTSAGAPLKMPAPEELEREIREVCSTWEDRFFEALLARDGEARGLVLAARYEDVFPPILRVVTHPRQALLDVDALEGLHESGEPQFSLFFDEGGTRETTTLRIFLPDARLLSDLLPVVDHFRIRVVDAQQVQVEPADRPPAFVNVLRVLPLGADQADLDVIAPRLTQGLRAALLGIVPSDELNGMVLEAGLDWREVDCVRAYLEYLNQIQGTLDRRYLRRVLLENPLAVRVLVRTFRARLDPAVPEARRADLERQAERDFEAYRDRITALNEDRALAWVAQLIRATLRTNFFAKIEGPHRIAFKLEPAKLPELRPPQPYREIFVHTADLMGVHLRGGPVARGGLRWSDRIEDLRMEILGLMRTQTLKNALIVPVGAKGGFVLKRTGLTAQEERAFADEQYRIFIRALLDLADNVDASGAVRPPEGVVRRDEDDPYLVVAADKGTAHLSDAANAIALECDFWLGDAFASGGSEGYDHKRTGITARGALECVKHLFGELGIDPEKQTYTVAGIGDMSGDVFGNGLLRMRRARLLAAFDHRHVFLDPDPDPDVAFEERERLFQLPRSSWADYDPARLSPGGGVFPRSAKRIPLSNAARERLGIDAESATGPEVVRSILRMPVDLLWNGGIGTYVKASTESHLDVGDRANDAVRVDANELRARVVGEGGNLGFTQAARVEAALAGVRLDTDAIHNSGGVDLSDHEVNLKVLLAPLVRSGRIEAGQRHDALFGVVDEVCERVLRHNRSQSLALSLEERRSRADPEPFLAAIAYLCDAEGVRPADGRMPDAATLDARRARGAAGLTRPEHAWLLGLAKLHTRRRLAESDLVEHPYLEALYRDYFPVALQEAWPEAIASHRLRREITALELTNRLVDAGGATLVPSLVMELGVSVPRAAEALVLFEDIVRIPSYRERLGALGPQISHEAVYECLLAIDGATRAGARYLVGSDQVRLSTDLVARWGVSLMTELRPNAEGLLTPGELRRMEERVRELSEHGLPLELAVDLATVGLADRGLNLVSMAERIQAPLLDVARVYAHVGESACITWVYDRLEQVRATDPWDRIVLLNLRSDLLDLQARLTEAVLAPKPTDPIAASDAFLAERGEALERVREIQRRALASPSPSALAVVGQVLLRLRQTLER